MTSLFCGSALSEVDPDGIVRLPGFLAEALQDASGEDLLLATHESEGCLIGYGRSHLHELYARTERWRLADEAAARGAHAHHRRMRRAFGIVEAALRDENDAFRIPEALRQLGRIQSLALFVGTGDRFEIWNPDLAAANGDSVLRDLALFRMSAWRRRPPRKPARPRRAAGTRASARRREGK